MLSLVPASAAFASQTPFSSGSTFMAPEVFGSEFSSWAQCADAGPEAWTTGDPDSLPCIKVFTYDFDGTTETTDLLAHHVFDQATEAEKLTDLIPAYKRVKKETGGTAAMVDTYFGGAERIEYFNGYVKILNEATGGQVHVLSASWAPTPAAVWKNYIVYVLADVGILMPAEKVVATDDPGADVAADKAAPAMELAAKAGVPMSQLLHSDNGFKYDCQLNGAAAYAVYPTPTTGSAAPMMAHDFQLQVKMASACPGVPTPDMSGLPTFVPVPRRVGSGMPGEEEADCFNKVSTSCNAPP